MDTVKIKHKDNDGNDHLVINRSDYDPKKHKLFDEESNDPTATMSEDEKKMLADDESRRKVQGNRGITGGPGILGDGKNPSGTYSEPTPTDIRYPNKDHTEFENNHGAFVGKSAAQMREAAGLPDAPGGLNPVTDFKIPEDWASQTLSERREIVKNLGGQNEGTMKSADVNAYIQTASDRAKTAETAKQPAAGPTPGTPAPVVSTNPVTGGSSTKI